jgi:hypothetical protein
MPVGGGDEQNATINPAERDLGRDSPSPGAAQSTEIPDGEQMSKPSNPFAEMPRCGATTRAGTPCRRIGNRRNLRCILHGGRAGAPAGERNGRWKHGNATQEATAQRRMIRDLLREADTVTRGDK